jgi:hypothetical protein
MEAVAPVQHCPSCGAVLKRPEWSERVGEQQVARVWHCTGCGHECETRDEGISQEPSAAELAGEFLPNLVVE